MSCGRVRFEWTSAKSIVATRASDQKANVKRAANGRFKWTGRTWSTKFPSAVESSLWLKRSWCAKWTWNAVSGWSATGCVTSEEATLICQPAPERGGRLHLKNQYWAVGLLFIRPLLVSAGRKCTRSGPPHIFWRRSVSIEWNEKKSNSRSATSRMLVMRVHLTIPGETTRLAFQSFDYYLSLFPTVIQRMNGNFDCTSTNCADLRIFCCFQSATWIPRHRPPHHSTYGTQLVELVCQLDASVNAESLIPCRNEAIHSGSDAADIRSISHTLSPFASRIIDIRKVTSYQRPQSWTLPHCWEETRKRRHLSAQKWSVKWSIAWQIEMKCWWIVIQPKFIFCQ